MHMIAPLSAPDNPYSWEQFIGLTGLSSRPRAEQHGTKVGQVA